MAEKDWNIDDYIPTEDSTKNGYDNSEIYKAWHSVNEQLNKSLVIAFLGTASSGKTSGIKALFGIDFGNIHPIPGSTTEVKVVPISNNVFLADAPGFGDIKKEVSLKAKEICDSVDIFIYILNAEGGFKIQEKEDYLDLVSYNREVLVVLNKIDLIRPHHKDEFIEDQRKKMGVKSENFISASFDPLPQISSTPINLDAVQGWIQNILEKKGKDLLFAKVARDKDKICERWIKGACAPAFAIGAIPIPGSDYIPLTALQVGLMAKIAITYGHSPDKKDITAFIGQTFTGQIGKQIFRGILTALKAAGWFPIVGWPAEAATAALAAAIASSATYGLGKAAQAYYKSGMQLPISEIQQIFKQYYDLGRKQKKEALS